MNVRRGQDGPARLRIYRNDSANESRPGLPRVVHEAQTIVGVPPTPCLQSAESGFKYSGTLLKSTHNRKIQAENGVLTITIFRLLIFL